MTKNIWLVSDTHFNHSNILNFTDDSGRKVRDFDSVQEMNETMIQNWNANVRPGDKVYHLGDVFFGSKDSFKSLWPRLMGSKRLIVGNHDDIEFLSSGGFFKKVYMWRIFREFNVILSHVPMHESNLYNRTIQGNSLNIHGHIHNNDSPKGPYRNVCVEKTNYTPIHIEDAIKGFK